MNINLQNLFTMKTLVRNVAGAMLAVFFISVFFTQTDAAILTVSNNPNSPGQYTNLQTAINASSQGDTILVAGSSSSYGSMSLPWQLTIFGAGIHNPYGQNTTVSSISLNNTNTSLGSSGSKISGFVLTSNLVFNGSFSGGSSSDFRIDSVVIERCYFGYLYSGIEFGDYRYKDDTIRNCFFSCYQGYNVRFDYVGTYDDIVLHNNLFQKGYIGTTGSYSTGKLATVFFKNNLFIDRVGNAFSGPQEIVIENNIFYAHAPQGCSQCVFTKNATYQNNDNTIPYGTNIGSGNLVNTDPEFVDYPFLGGAHSWSYDYHLQVTSPLIGQATDGSDIGIYGGPMPVEFGSNPPIPQMIELTLPSSSVPVGGTLNVNFKAKKQD
jgi:hypothetical protein